MNEPLQRPGSLLESSVAVSDPLSPPDAAAGAEREKKASRRERRRQDQRDRTRRRRVLALRQRVLVRSTWAYFAVVVLFDSAVAGLSVHYAVRWRYDFLNRLIPNDVHETAGMLAFAVAVVVWSCSRVPRAVWRFVSLDDLRRLGVVVVTTVLLTTLVMFLFVDRGAYFPRSVPLIAAPVCFIILMAARLLVVAVRNGDVRAVFRRPRSGRPNAVLVGSPTALHRAVRDMTRRDLGPSVNVVGLVDSSESTTGRSIRGVQVVGSLSRLRDVYGTLRTKYGEPPQLISVDRRPTRGQSARLVKLAAEVGAPLSRLLDGDKPGELTPFEAQDLIGRPPRTLDIAPVRRLVRGRSVLVTGAGGSIGSELARQIAALGPSLLTLFDSSEFNLYRIDREIGERFPHLDRAARLGDVTDRRRVDEVWREARPAIVLHAAALKHVPLGETNPFQTLHTNVEGTRATLEASVAHGVGSFTLVSTDKAVLARNVMGASKGVAEQLVHAFDRAHPDFHACAVRFGNVLASTGSVIPLFDEQIARGGPVTVTDADATRYFMTTHEASALVLQATALDATQKQADSSIYVLEMGEPVNIASLARQLIRLRGLVPGRDIEIEYTGLRPGESLDERVVGGQECLETTYVDGLLRIAQTSRRPPADPDAVARRVSKLVRAVDARDGAGLRKVLKALLPRYDPPPGLLEGASHTRSV